MCIYRDTDKANHPQRSLWKKNKWPHRHYYYNQLDIKLPISSTLKMRSELLRTLNTSAVPLFAFMFCSGLSAFLRSREALFEGNSLSAFNFFENCTNDKEDKAHICSLISLGIV